MFERIIGCLLFLWVSSAWAQEDFGEYEEEARAPEQAQSESVSNEASDQNFDQIMYLNAAPAQSAEVAAQNTFGVAMGSLSAPSAFPKKAIVPLTEYERIRTAGAERANLGPQGPRVILGAASYEGELRDGALRLKVTVDVTLGASAEYKFVPLVGATAVLVEAKEGGQPVTVVERDGYHVWVTRRSGEVRLELQVFIPARGPRGSIEFDFAVPRTPVTSVRCQFPGAGLEPRVDSAVSSSVESSGSSTVVRATLRPTTRIHIVGFKDFGSDSDSSAKIYAQSSNLLSVDDGGLEIFSVIRYTILYGAVKEFLVSIPPDVEVVSADGEGAFRHVLEKAETGEGMILRGETEFPIRGGYEISLRLKRELKREGAQRSSMGAFAAPIPRAIGVEREQGYLGIEVPGKLKLEQKSIREVLAIDVRQLPPDMVESAVSPVLKAYRYHAPNAEVQLVAERLPEKDPASASIDRVKGTSVLSPEGRTLTQLEITLRNRIRPALILDLSPGTEIRSTLLDGEPVKPSRDEKGRLILPLKRSEGGDSMTPFTVEVVLESDVGEFGSFGRKRLQLPSLDLPISSLEWSVFVPARNQYSKLTSDVGAQAFAGEASWHEAPFVDGEDFAPEESDGAATPVRFEIPQSGIRLEHQRYWIESGQSVPVSFAYVRSWLILPSRLLGAMALFGLLLLGIRSAHLSSRRARLALVVGLGLMAAKIGALVAFAALVVLDVARRERWLVRASTQFEAWWSTVPARFAQRERPAQLPITRRLLRLGFVGFALLMLSVLAGEVSALLWIIGT